MERESVDEVLAELAAGLDRAESLALACQAPQDHARWVCGLQRVRARLDAVACRAAASAASSDIPVLEGQRTVAAVVAANTGCNPRPIAADQRIGSWLIDFPEFGEAFAAGRLSRAHVEALRAADSGRTKADLVDAQEYLISAAETCQWSEFTQVVRYWQLGADPDGPEPVEQAESRYCRFAKEADGTVVGRFRLDPIAGQAVLSALEQEVQRLFRADTEAASLRTSSQRQADALLNVMVRGAARPDGAAPAPLVHLVISEQVVEQLLTEDGTCRLDAKSIDGRCELVDGTPIHPALALTTLAAASFRRQVLNPASETVDLGRRVRGFPPKLRQALLVAARGRCQVRGCDAPFPWLQADHIHPWHRHGPTDLANGQILCDPHNKAKGNR